MLRRWLMYLVFLAGCLVFLFAYQQQYAWVVFLAVFSRLPQHPIFNLSTLV